MLLLCLLGFFARTYGKVSKIFCQSNLHLVGMEPKRSMTALRTTSHHSVHGTQTDYIRTIIKYCLYCIKTCMHKDLLTYISGACAHVHA